MSEFPWDECPFPKKKMTIPIGRVIEKLDEYLGRDDMSGARRHLLYWLDEAVAAGDRHGELSVCNELIGLYRKTGVRDEAMSFSDRALSLCRELGLTDTVTYATTLLNAATAMKAFGDSAQAIGLYEEAQTLYEQYLEKDDPRLGGLYNNMGLCLLDEKQYGRARKAYEKALSVMNAIPGKEPEAAITYCNLADLIAEEKGLLEGEAQIGELMRAAWDKLNTPGLAHDGNYTYVCEKCAPVFGYYGFFLEKNELAERARRYYERP